MNLKFKKFKIDFDNWTFGVEEGAYDLLKEIEKYLGSREDNCKKIFAEVLQEGLEENGCSFYLPIKWAPSCDGINGPPVKNPLDVYVSLDFLSSDTPPYLKGNFSDCIDNFLENLSGGNETPSICKVQKKSCIKLIKALDKEKDKVVKFLKNSVERS